MRPRNPGEAAEIPSGKFDFGLTDAEEARAERLHRESVVFDLVAQHAGGDIVAHYPHELQQDFLARMGESAGGFRQFFAAQYWPYEMSRLGRSDLILEWYRVSGLTCGTYDVAVGTDPQFDGLEELTQLYAALPWLRYVTTAAGIRDAKREGHIAFYGFWQPVFPAPRDLTALDRAYARGLRSFMLTYNQMDNIGVGCTERVDAGLSRYGLEAVKHCNELGIIVDVSHCGHMTTLDACQHSRKPVNANHTAAHHLSGHARAKRDDALRAIASTGGVIGVVTVPIFLTPESDPTINAMLDHIDYIANLVGWEHVAVGTDHPLQAPDWLLRRLFQPMLKDIGFRDADSLDITQRLAGFQDGRDLPNITRGLVSRSYDDEQIRGILGENALRVFEEVCG